MHAPPTPFSPRLSPNHHQPRLQEPPIGWLEPVSPLVKAAHDPRVKAVVLRIGPLNCG